MKLFIWSDFDLDGVGSILMMKWMYPTADITYKTAKVNSFREEFLKWCSNDSINNYDRVFILDLDVSSSIDLVDDERVVVIDHHKTHVLNIPLYKKAKTLIEESTSCMMLMYKKFSSKCNLTVNQKKLLILVDDYDSYSKKVKESIMLNNLFTDLQRGEYANKVDRFIAEFCEGFNGFSVMQTNIIKFYENRIARAKEECEFFEGEVLIQKKSRKIKAVVSTVAINELCDDILSGGYDLAIAFNPKTLTVSFRTGCDDLDVSIIAEKLCGGGGHKYAAGGKMSEKFAEFTKLLKKSK